MKNVILKISCWCHYIAAILNWGGDVLRLKTFPKKSDYFAGVGVGQNDSRHANEPLRHGSQDSGNVGGGVTT